MTVARMVKTSKREGSWQSRLQAASEPCLMVRNSDLDICPIVTDLGVRCRIDLRVPLSLVIHYIIPVAIYAIKLYVVDTHALFIGSVCLMPTQ